jgi:hypothetical protein
VIHIQNAKKYLPIFQASTTAAATASGTFDVSGYDYVTIDVLLPTADVVSNTPSVLKLSESDTTNGTFTDVSGFVGGTDFTIPNAITVATSITQPFATLNVDCRARKKILKLSVSPRTTQVVSAVVNYTRAEQTPSTSSQATVVVNG